MIKKEDLVLGRKYVVTGGEDCHNFKIGTKVTYHGNDNSTSPEFRDKQGKTQFVHIKDISPLEPSVPKHDLSQTYTLTEGNFTLSLEGDGTITPRFRLDAAIGEASGFISAAKLRSFSKQLKKWAKALEQHSS